MLPLKLWLLTNSYCSQLPAFFLFLFLLPMIYMCHRVQVNLDFRPLPGQVPAVFLESFLVNSLPLPLSWAFEEVTVSRSTRWLPFLGEGTRIHHPPVSSLVASPLHQTGHLSGIQPASYFWEASKPLVCPWSREFPSLHFHKLSFLFLQSACSQGLPALGQWHRPVEISAYISPPLSVLNKPIVK